MNSWQRFLWLPIVPLAIILPFLIIAGGGDAQVLAEAEIHPITWILIGTLAVILLAITCFATAYFGLSLWRALRRLVPHRKE